VPLCQCIPLLSERTCFAHASCDKTFLCDLVRATFLSLNSALSWHAYENILKRSSGSRARSSRPHWQSRKDRSLQPPNPPPPAGPGPCQASKPPFRKVQSLSLTVKVPALAGVGRDMVRVLAARASSVIRRALNGLGTARERAISLTLITTAR
jgi:hypothetical protein